MTRRTLWDAAGVLVVASGYWLAHAWLTPFGSTDNDRYYHLAVSRLASWTGHLATLPQVEDLGWGTRFVDKEYLFHVFTTWGERLAGASGVAGVQLILAMLACAALYVLCRQGAAPGSALLFTLAGAVACSAFIARLGLLRPHVLAIGAALWLCAALAARRPVLAAVAAAAFALGYHALYVPFALVLVFGVVFARERSALVSAGAALAGLALGALLNPYFPSSVALGVLQVSVGLGAHENQGIGVELTPLSTLVWLTRYGAPLALLALVALRPWHSPFSDPAQRSHAVWLGASALGFWVLACVTPRAAEYAVPLTIAAAAHALADLSWRWRAVVCGGALVLQLPGWRGARELTPSDRYALAIPDALAHLPAAAAQKKVLNCSFDEGEVLLGLRPDVRFVDVLDPMLLKKAAPALATLREAFQQGHVLDALAVVKESFRADYVLCGYPAALRMLDADPRFVRLFPAPGAPPHDGPFHALYGLSGLEVPAVHRFAMAGVAGAELQTMPRLPYLDLHRAPRASADGCVRLRVATDEVARLAGATYALLGGGPRLTLRSGEAALYESARPFEFSGWNSVLVPLPGPLEPGQALSVDVCPDPSAPFLGVALSLWTRAQLVAACARVGLQGAACFAPLAAPVFGLEPHLK